MYKYLKSNPLNFSPFLLLRIVEKYAWLYVSDKNEVVVGFPETKADFGL